MELNASDIYDAPSLDHARSPRFETPDLDDEITPDDSISVAWFKGHERGAPPRGDQP